MSYVKIITQVNAGKGLDLSKDTERADVISRAFSYSNEGADEIAFMDMTARKEDREPNVDFMKAIAKKAEVSLIAYGGVKRLEDVKKMLYAGAELVYMGRAAKDDINFVKEMSDRFGSDKIGVVIDLNDSNIKEFAISCKQMGAGHLWIMGNPVGNERIIKDIRQTVGIPVMISTDSSDENVITELVKATDADAVLYTGAEAIDCMAVKRALKNAGVSVNTFESAVPFSEFKLNADGLIPCIVQDYKTSEVLMMAYMNEESYNKTLETGRMTYFSRSRQKLWVKGEESGHFQFVKELIIDCDKDTILAKVSQIGVACHTGNPTCFFTPLASKEYNSTNPLTVFNEVYNTIVDRKKNPKEGSYTNYLFDKGIDKILKKVGEECTEIVIAAKNPDPEEIKYEISDFLYHCMVLMVERGVTWEDIMKELDNRH
ncbi:MAG: bifunctional phosphoribosyl-AMP cyclohydrolase/phosphoribosyl-ATP diphosphatase HisIE [Lachnospiraceae bacterium]|nr:bifunctional phosphoribosyl-AMP cyclohydrolase/phosphoribosyl-ATP diphosphatase HisIE [Lachnospiraceae bacterium]